MFGQDRQQLRRFYHDVWHKMQAGQDLTALEKNIAVIISEHPEYHSIFATESSLEQDYFVEQGQTNPYLHMSLHMSLHEQIATNRPQGIQSLYYQLQAKYGSAHQTEHQMMECLTESLWLAQRNNTSPSESDYLAALERLLD
jgi:hypothetical protein